ncbi:MAG: 16S rRNA (guanine(966)-N(2))-methyltransferase RsmD [Phycisphaerales bacterium]|nr:16S rRNA (guanine(966)-N(2))-methyltransferase RsmD [Phycisphaerales bacterium]
MDPEDHRWWGRQRGLWGYQQGGHLMGAKPGKAAIPSNSGGKLIEFRSHGSLALTGLQVRAMLSWMIRIITGHYRSRRLKTPADADTTRPYAHRVKESVFNVLRGHIEDANVLDLFAGVGSMGLESVSRGAANVLMVEQDRKIFGLLKENVDELGCQDRADILCGDALGSVAILRSPRPLSVVFIDPPFKLMEQEGTRQRVLSQMQRLAPLLAEDALIVLRSPLGPDEIDLAVEGLAGPEVRTFRRHHEVLLYGPEGTSSTTEVDDPESESEASDGA